jgi:PAS domain S-box-containing protein
MNAAIPATDLFFDQAACGLAAVDANGIIITANASLHRWLGMAPASLVGMRMRDLLPIGARLFHHTCCAPQLQSYGAVHDLQFDLLTHSGARLPVLLNIVRQREREREIDHWALFRAYGHAHEHMLRARQAAEDVLDDDQCRVRPSI